MIGELHGEGHGQLTAGRSLTAQDVGYAVTTLLTSLPCQQDCIGQVLPRGSFNDTTNVEYHNHLLTGCVKSFADVGNQLVLLLAEVEVS